MNATLNHTNNIIDELESAIEQKIMLLQCLDVIYTKAMEYLDKQEFDLFLEKIEDHQIIAESIEKIEADVKRIIAQPGVSGEVIAMGSGSCSSAFAIWQGSSGHYAVLTSALASSGGIACVKDSDGTFWAVGRVA